MSKIGLVADDDEYFRMAISTILRDKLGFVRVVETGSFDEALDRLEREDHVDLAVFDLNMPGLDSPAGLRTIRDSFEQVQKLAVVSATKARGDILQSLEAGAHGFVSKGQAVGELRTALQKILDGELYVSPVLDELRSSSDTGHGTPHGTPHGAGFSGGLGAGDTPRLTPRQTDVLGMLVEGKSNKEIARALDLGPGTVKVHLAAVFRTLGVSNRAAAAVAGAELLRRLPR